MDISTLIQLYIAWVVVVYIHELGHFPKKIEFNWFPIPIASAINARSRLGGLLIGNLLMIYLVSYFKPSFILFQYIGLIAWLHFIIYLILGSILEEPFENLKGFFYDYNNNKKKDKSEKYLDLNKFVFDDVDNKYWYLFIPLAILIFLIFKSYYLPIFNGVIM